MSVRTPGLSELLTKFGTEVWSGPKGLDSEPRGGPAAILIMREVDDTFTLLDVYATNDALETSAALRVQMRGTTTLGMMVVRRDSESEAREVAHHFAIHAASILTDAEAELLLAHGASQATGGPRSTTINHSMSAVQMGLAEMSSAGTLTVTPLGFTWLAGNFVNGKRVR